MAEFLRSAFGNACAVSLAIAIESIDARLHGQEGHDRWIGVARDAVAPTATKAVTAATPSSA